MGLEPAIQPMNKYENTSTYVTRGSVHVFDMHLVGIESVTLADAPVATTLSTMPASAPGTSYANSRLMRVSKAIFPYRGHVGCGLLPPCIVP
jgi:hypothetical protein